MAAGDLLGAAIIAWALTGKEWGAASFTGTAVKQMYITTGMFDIDVVISCGKNWGEDLFCGALLKFSGKDSITHFVGVASSLPGANGASDFERIQTANNMILVGFIWTLVCLLISVVCAHFYWNTDHDPRWRAMTYTFGGLGPVSFLIALVMWSVFMPDLHWMPNSWLPQGTAPFIGFKAVPAPQYGSDFLRAAIGLAILVVTNGIAPCYVQPHPKEYDDTDARFDRLEALDERLDLAKAGQLPASYGATTGATYVAGGGGMMVMGGQDFGVHGGQPAVMSGNFGPMGAPTSFG